MNNQSFGPVFGGVADLCIGNSSNTNDSCWANIGNTYKNDEHYPAGKY
jgi:hypothetical protein